MEEHYPQILRRYMGEERIGSYEYYDKATKDAADICGAGQGASKASKRSEPVSRQERAQYSEEVNAWTSSNNEIIRANFRNKLQRVCLKSLLM